MERDSFTPSFSNSACFFGDRRKFLLLKTKVKVALGKKHRTTHFPMYSESFYLDETCPLWYAGG